MSDIADRARRFIAAYEGRELTPDGQTTIAFARAMVALSAERAAIVEECAKVADRYAQIGHDKGIYLMCKSGEDIASYIRSLSKGDTNAG